MVSPSFSGARSLVNCGPVPKQVGSVLRQEGDTTNLPGPQSHTTPVVETPTYGDLMMNYTIFATLGNDNKPCWTLYLECN